jgi:hypothetical protein
MAPNFCSVCGNIPDVSTNETVKCDACGEVNPSMRGSLSISAFPFLANASQHRHYTLPDSDIYDEQFPFASSHETLFEDAGHHA